MTALQKLLVSAAFASLWAVPGALVASESPVQPAEGASRAASSIHIVYMGGNDCPPCVAWRAFELPKLRKTAEFQDPRVRFTHVEKVISSPVPPAFFLPADVKPYKSVLDAAGNGGPGSAQVAILVDGKVHDYFFGTRTADEYQAMLRSVLTGTPYPTERCVQMSRMGRSCAVRP